MSKPRATFTGTDVQAGCFDCSGSAVMWSSRNAMALAARHHDATGHATWCEQILAVRYGHRGGGEQLGLFEDGDAR